MNIVSLDDVTRDREAREKRAAERAATLEPGDYFASDNGVCHWVYHRSEERSFAGIECVIECETHWDACLVLIALGTRNQ